MFTPNQDTARFTQCCVGAEKPRPLNVADIDNLETTCLSLYDLL